MKTGISMTRRLAMTALAVVALALGGMGCENGGGGDDDGGGGSVTGTWALFSGAAGEGSPAWYIHFNNDSTYFISDNQDGSGVRVRGTYDQSGSSVTGPFTNPGVGNGRIEATVNGSSINLNFIEYWHTPNKVVPYAGTKI